MLTKLTIVSTLMVASVLTNDLTMKPLREDWSPDGVNMTEMRYYLTALRASLQGF